MSTSDATPAPDDYAFWRGALAENYPYPMQDGRFECGFWRTKNRDGRQVPVAIWKHNGELRISVDGNDIEPERFAGRWNFTWQNPITYDAYTYRIKNGEWPGDIPDEIGRNAPPDDFAMLKDNIEDVARQAAKWLQGVGEIVSQENADKAANYREALNKLKKKADACRKEEKEPLAEQVKAVDGKYNPLIHIADQTAVTLRDALTAFMRKQEAEARRIAEEERKRQEAERKALAEQDIALATLEPELPAPPPAAKIQAGGQFGRKTGFRTVKRTEITDYPAALAFFKDNPEVRALIQKLADKVTKVGGTVPGVEVKEERVAA